MINITEEFKMLNSIRIALNTKNLMFYSNSIYAIDDTTKSNFRFTSVNPMFGIIKDYSVFDVGDINEIFKISKSSKKPIIYVSHNDTIMCDDLEIKAVDIDTTPIFKLLSNVSIVFNGIPNYSADITDNEELMSALRAKATEPGIVCVIAGTNYFMTLFYGIVRLNARDTLSLDVFDFTHNSFISKFTVGKSGFDVTHIVRFLYK